jgi:hypothetical protein
VHGHSELAYAETQYGQCGDEPLALQMKVETVEKTLHIEVWVQKTEKVQILERSGVKMLSSGAIFALFNDDP